MAKARVYFTREITPQAMDRLYDALGIRLSGKTAVKISTGEPGGHNFLQPALIGPLTERLHGTIVECNTAYEGRRNTTQEHWKAIQEHGFLDIAPCDIMDETGELALPVTNGMHLQENFVGAHLRNYDSMLVLSHFKGHMMGGFGGALKNISIGIASAHGKAHSRCGCSRGAMDGRSQLFSGVHGRRGQIRCRISGAAEHGFYQCCQPPFRGL